MKYFLVLSVLVYLGVAVAIDPGHPLSEHRSRLIASSTRKSLREWHASGRSIVKAERHSFPYIASLQAPYSSNEMEHICSSVILDKDTVLTTGSCILPVLGLPMVVVAGAHDISIVEEAQQVRQVVNFTLHPKIQLGAFPKNDFAFLSLDASFNLNSKVKVIPEFNTEPVAPKDCAVSGWFNDLSLPPYNDELQMANLTVLENTACEELLSGWGVPAHETNLCAGIQGEAEGWLEVGGPLVCAGKFVGLTGLPILQLFHPSAPIIVYSVGVNGTWLHSI